MMRCVSYNHEHNVSCQTIAIMHGRQTIGVTIGGVSLLGYYMPMSNLESGRHML